MANTPFLDLVKPAGTDRALVSVINSNSDKIDTGVSTLSEQIATLRTKSFSLGGVNNAVVITRVSQHQIFIVIASSQGGNQSFVVASNAGIANLGAYGKAAWSQNQTTLTFVVNNSRHIQILSNNTISYTTSSVDYSSFVDGSSWNPYMQIGNDLQIPQRKITTTVAATIDSLAKFDSVLADAGRYYIETNASIRTTFVSLGLLPENLVGNLEARKIASNYFFLHFQSYSNREWIATIDNGTLSAWKEL